MGGGQIEAPRGLQTNTGHGRRCGTAQHRFATFAATLDPATVTALGLAGARIWGALA